MSALQSTERRGRVQSIVWSDGFRPCNAVVFAPLPLSDVHLEMANCCAYELKGFELLEGQSGLASCFCFARRERD